MLPSSDPFFPLASSSRIFWCQAPRSVCDPEMCVWVAERPRPNQPTTNQPINLQLALQLANKKLANKLSASPSASNSIVVGTKTCKICLLQCTFCKICVCFLGQAPMRLYKRPSGVPWRLRLRHTSVVKVSSTRDDKEQVRVCTSVPAASQPAMLPWGRSASITLPWLR